MTYRSLAIALIVFFVLMFVFVVVGLFLIPLAGDPQFAQEPAGFWYGLWHGMTAPIAFLMSLFGGENGIYEPSNTGALYNFGYLMGICSVAGGGSSSATSRKST